jgi:cobalt-zinc-cadmium efflux system outer membrane protein
VAYAAELAVVYATAEAMLGRQALATENLARANEELAAARALVDSGKEASLRSAQARASVSAAQAAEAAATNDATQALARLSALSGASEPYTAVTSSLLTAQPAILNAPTALGESPRCALPKPNAMH